MDLIATKLLLLFALMPVFVFAELVSLDVKVSDLDGRPIANAEVNMAAKKKRTLS